MTKHKTVTKVFHSTPVIEGAGVHLFRGFGHEQAGTFDPFLLFDDFRNNDPKFYKEGFPWHPHRGIETITYMLAGSAEHGDSLGNAGVIGPGDVQWMTAGGGIIHQEMPKGDDDGKMEGFQLWVNLPKEHKMMHPRYRDVKACSIPIVEDGGVSVKVICGSYNGVSGPVQDIVVDCSYFDVTLNDGAVFHHQPEDRHSVFMYVYQGSLTVNNETELYTNRMVVQFSGEGSVKLAAGKDGACVLFVSGTPLNEPIAWGGPIVMNTQAELRQAFEDYHSGKFLQKNNE